MAGKELTSSTGIQNRIHTLRNVQIILDSHLADLYQVEVKMLNRAAKRNLDRFPQEFMFQLTEDEFQSVKVSMEDLENEHPLRFQIGTLKKDLDLKSQNGNLNKRGQHRKYLPYAFTEQGVAMLSAVLRSETAVKTSIQIINAFVAMRRFIATNAQVFHRLDAVEKKQIEIKILKKYSML